MPRWRIPVTLSTRPRTANQKIVEPGQPRLWNAKRRIKTNKGLLPAQFKEYLQDPFSDKWREQVSPDVIEFIDNHKLRPDEKAALLRNPSRYFSRPYNVPVNSRQQSWFPNARITLMRTPHLAPRYATFRVPLWFNKLDLKDYLSSLYNVEVLHVRSVVLQAKVKRKRAHSPYSKGKLIRPKSKKKMTAQLVDPFIWPEEVKDFEGWEKEEYYRSAQAQLDQNRRESQYAQTNANNQHRQSIAEQAKALLNGKTSWKPTWQSFPQEVRVMSDIQAGNGVYDKNARISP